MGEVGLHFGRLSFFLYSAVKQGLRESDVELVRRDLTLKFADEDLMREYFFACVAMPQMCVSTDEIAVSFTDLLGAARTFVGFSGTMGIAPPYKDARRGLELVLVADSEQLALAEEHVKTAKCHVAAGKAVLQRVVKRATELLAQKRFVCVVDASGVLGAYEDDVAELERALQTKVGSFDESGKLRNGDRGVRYYRHRDSRGVDSEMPTGSVGLVMFALDARWNDGAHAIYRLRLLDTYEHTARDAWPSRGAQEHRYGRPARARGGHRPSLQEAQGCAPPPAGRASRTARLDPPGSRRLLQNSSMSTRAFQSISRSAQKNRM